MRGHSVRGITDDKAPSLGPGSPRGNLEDRIEFDNICLAHHISQHIHPWGVRVSQEVNEGRLDIIDFCFSALFPSITSVSGLGHLYLT